MRTIARAQKIISTAPGEALSDTAGIALLALLVFAGFLLPGVL